MYMMRNVFFHPILRHFCHETSCSVSVTQTKSFASPQTSSKGVMLGILKWNQFPSQQRISPMLFIPISYGYVYVYIYNCIYMYIYLRLSKPPPRQQTRLKTMQPGVNILCLSARPVQNKNYGTWNHGVMYKFGSPIWFVNFLYDANTKNWTAYCTNWFPANTLQPKLQTRQCGVRILLPLGTNQSPHLFACPRWTHLDESFCDHNASAALSLDYRV